MRRADRLFRLVELLRSRRHATGQWLADALQVSLRTLYRDIHDLTLSGVPIEGEAGVGYRLRYRLDVPPLMFSTEELEALLIGSRMVQAWGDTELGASAAAALAKIRNVLPEPLLREVRAAQIFSPPLGGGTPWLGSLRLATRHRQQVRVAYVKENGEASERTLWPLGLFFWGRSWTLIAWCVLRDDFRHFRVDRVRELTLLDAVFPDQPGRRLDDYFDQLEAREGIRVERD